jgi:hypothetical protein
MSAPPKLLSKNHNRITLFQTRFALSPCHRKGKWGMGVSYNIEVQSHRIKENSMISKVESKKRTTRRGFVKEVSFGAAAVSFAGAFSELEASPIQGAQGGGQNASPIQSPGVAPSRSKYSKYFIEGSKPGRMPALGKDQDFVFTFSFVKADARAHDPHTHPHTEILGFFSADPNSPDDLGAEVEMVMGEELERVVMTKSTLLFLPPDTIHCPMIFRNVRKPFIFLATAPVGKLVEKSYAHLLPEDQRQKPKSKAP